MRRLSLRVEEPAGSQPPAASAALVSIAAPFCASAKLILLLFAPPLLCSLSTLPPLLRSLSTPPRPPSHSQRVTPAAAFRAAAALLVASAAGAAAAKKPPPPAPAPPPPFEVLVSGSASLTSSESSILWDTVVVPAGVTLAYPYLGSWTGDVNTFAAGGSFNVYRLSFAHANGSVAFAFAANNIFFSSGGGAPSTRKLRQLSAAQPRAEPRGAAQSRAAARPPNPRARLTPPPIFGPAPPRGQAPWPARAWLL